jgi:hypothetical protein
VTVQEHYNTGKPVLYISQTDEAAFRALTGFTAYVDARMVQPSTATYASGALEIANLYDRAIGVFGAAEVWIKPWAIANYIFGYIQGPPPPLVMRQPTFAALGELNLVTEDERYPLRARGYERQFGMGVWNRTNGAVLYFAGGDLRRADDHLSAATDEDGPRRGTGGCPAAAPEGRTERWRTRIATSGRRRRPPPRCFP